MKWYSKELQNLDDPKDEDYPQARWNISPMLLHDVILMEVRSYTMKYKAFKKREKELLMIGLRAQINELQDSNELMDTEKLEVLKRCLQDVIDNDNKEAAVQIIVIYHLEEEKLIRFFVL